MFVPDQEGEEEAEEIPRHRQHLLLHLLQRQVITIITARQQELIKERVIISGPIHSRPIGSVEVEAETLSGDPLVQKLTYGKVLNARLLRRVVEVLITEPVPETSLPEEEEGVVEEIHEP